MTNMTISQKIAVLAILIYNSAAHAQDVDAEIQNMSASILKMANDRLGRFLEFKRDLDMLNDSLNQANAATGKSQAALKAQFDSELNGKQAKKAAGLKKIDSTTAAVMDSIARLKTRSGAAVSAMNLPEINTVYSANVSVVDDSAKVMTSKFRNAYEIQQDKGIKAYSDSTGRVLANTNAANAKEIKRHEDKRQAAIKNFLARSAINQRKK
jgi:hypothetical protein